MNILLTILLIVLGIVVLLAALIGLLILNSRLQFRRASRRSQAVLGPEAPIVEVDGLAFRDLNKNGKLDVYEDPRRPIEERVEDLLRQMTIEEKVGMMFHPMLDCTADGGLVERKPEFATVLPSSELIAGRQIKHFNIVSAVSPRSRP